MTPNSLLKKLISIPSVNPMGLRSVADTMCEKRLSDYLVGLFAELEIECERIVVQPDRHNVVARVTGNDKLPTILLDAHQDTVPVENMTIDPFEPTERAGRIYGRGACDVKGGMAAMICAMHRLAQTDSLDHPTVIMACTCDEELNQMGAANIVQLLNGQGAKRSSILNSKPDVAIVAEPTSLNIGVAHRGVTRWQIETHGKAAHSSDPSKGQNAIYQMARLVTAIERYAASLGTSDCLVESKTISVGRIVGGESVNIVPAKCSIEIDRRTVPGETAEQVIADLEAYLRNQFSINFIMSEPSIVASALSSAGNQGLAESLLQAAKASVADSEIESLPFTTHAPQYANAGIPTVVFGPGAIEQAHTVDEWIAIDQLEKATEIIYRFLVA